MIPSGYREVATRSGCVAFVAVPGRCVRGTWMTVQGLYAICSVGKIRRMSLKLGLRAFCVGVVLNCDDNSSVRVRQRVSRHIGLFLQHFRTCEGGVVRCIETTSRVIVLVSLKHLVESLKEDLSVLGQKHQAWTEANGLVPAPL